MPSRTTSGCAPSRSSISVARRPGLRQLARLGADVALRAQRHVQVGLLLGLLGQVQCLRRQRAGPVHVPGHGLDPGQVGEHAAGLSPRRPARGTPGGCPRTAAWRCRSRRSSAPRTRERCSSPSRRPRVGAACPSRPPRGRRRARVQLEQGDGCAGRSSTAAGPRARPAAPAPPRRAPPRRRRRRTAEAIREWMRARSARRRPPRRAPGSSAPGPAPIRPAPTAGCPVRAGPGPGPRPREARPGTGRSSRRAPVGSPAK